MCNRISLLGLVLLLTVAFAACSNGDDGSPATAPAPAAPGNFTLTPQAIKTFRFTWDDVAGETEYRLLENPDGVSGFTLVATIAADATGHELVVSLPARINARYILQSCNAGGCSDSATVSVSTSMVAAIGYVKASNTREGDVFGSALSLSADGSTLAVGASGEDSGATGINGNQADNSAGDSGAVYVFTRRGTTWNQQAYIKASNTGANDWFGRALSLSADGNTLAVGAPTEDSSATGINGDQGNDRAAKSGAVYVFTRRGTTWAQQAYVKASNTGRGDAFGHALSLSADGNTLAVGAPGEASSATGINGDQGNDRAAKSGAVYVFTRRGTTWTRQAYIKASNVASLDFFGYALSLSADGNTLAVDARGEASSAIGINGAQSNDRAAKSGAVYVFARHGTTWTLQAYLKASNTEADDFFGSALSLSADGNTLAVGAENEDSGATGINGDQADNTARDSGAVYVFTRHGTTWTQQAYIKASNTGPDDWLGFALSLSADGNTLAVGASGEDSGATGINGNQADNTARDSGAVYVFTRRGATWVQQAYIKASNTGPGDWLGYALGLSADGNTLAVGAPSEASSAIGINGNQVSNSAPFSGAVNLFSADCGNTRSPNDSRSEAVCSGISTLGFARPFHERP